MIHSAFNLNPWLVSLRRYAGVALPGEAHAELRRAIEAAARGAGLQPAESFVHKCVQAGRETMAEDDFLFLVYSPPRVESQASLTQEMKVFGGERG